MQSCCGWFELLLGLEWSCETNGEVPVGKEDEEAIRAEDCSVCWCSFCCLSLPSTTPAQLLICRASVLDEGVAEALVVIALSVAIGEVMVDVVSMWEIGEAMVLSVGVEWMSGFESVCSILDLMKYEMKQPRSTDLHEWSDNWTAYHFIYQITLLKFLG